MTYLLRYNVILHMFWYLGPSLKSQESLRSPICRTTSFRIQGCTFLQTWGPDKDKNLGSQMRPVKIFVVFKFKALCTGCQQINQDLISTIMFISAAEKSEMLIIWSNQSKLPGTIIKDKHSASSVLETSEQLLSHAEITNHSIMWQQSDGFLCK